MFVLGRRRHPFQSQLELRIDVGICPLTPLIMHRQADSKYLGTSFSYAAALCVCVLWCVSVKLTADQNRNKLYKLT